ncbi:NfeD family protein [Virgibacillus sp. Bac330]|uniref:NfeD family protein n=1 Tax=Virgibacillus sp. Bac330 TaxID=2419841 RepID=UPI000EF48530|nr:NfeD family protein [Virgibacillus sp. Bac330]
MTVFGLPIETLYLYMLIIAAALTIIYMLFGDILEGIGEVIPIANPILILAFVTFFSATGYLLETLTSLSSLIIIFIAMLIAFILDTLLNVFILVPLASAEESLGYTEESLIGRVGKIIIPVPADGYGEVVIESKSGRISKPVTAYHNQPIPEGTEVLILDIKGGVLYAEAYSKDVLDA